MKGSYYSLCSIKTKTLFKYMYKHHSLFSAITELKSIAECLFVRMMQSIRYFPSEDTSLVTQLKVNSGNKNMFEFDLKAVLAVSFCQFCHWVFYPCYSCRSFLKIGLPLITYRVRNNNSNSHSKLIPLAKELVGCEVSFACKIIV